MVDAIIVSERRRTWPDGLKLRMLSEAEAPGESICSVARRYEIDPAQMYQWRKKLRAKSEAPTVMLPMEVSEAAPPSSADLSLASSPGPSPEWRIEIALRNGRHLFASFLKPTRSLRMTRRFRCWTLVAAKPKPEDSGLMSAMGGPMAPTNRRRRFTGTPLIAKGKRPKDHLKDYSGFMHADGFADYDKLYGGKITEVACMAHVRRKLFDIAESTGSPIATEALNKIAELYAIEKDIRGSPPEARVVERRERAKPLLEELQQWFETKLAALPGRSALAGAIRYAISRMKRMGPYLESGICKLDNNTAERSVKGMAIGRKNYMFARSDAGGERAAAIYSLIETAKLNSVNPQAWLTDVLARIADHPINKIDERLPWRLGLAT